ncbi:MAG: hypothetical protein RL483_242 [Pseudomonadota bacterium]|jgi:phage-related protein
MWKILILNNTVQKELDSLEPNLKARFIHVCQLLEAFGPARVGMPHIRFLSDKLWEIRMNANAGNARAIYVTTAGRKIVVVHVFKKLSPKTPRKAIELALTRAKQIDE